jgi:hypothetical protein
MMTRARQTALITALVLLSFALTVWAASAQLGRGYPMIAPHGCAVVAAWEDGSAIAYCMDGTMQAFDPDGQPYANAAGVPIREPGWYPYHGPMILVASDSWGRRG